MGLIQDWAWRNRTDFGYEMQKETESRLLETAKEQTGTSEPYNNYARFLED